MQDRTRAILAPVLAVATVVSLAACATTESDSAANDAKTANTESAANGAAGGDYITIGTTDKITRIDPAGAYDKGSFDVMRQVYGFLVEPGAEDTAITPSLAESAEFTAPDEYTVKLKPDLAFANGNELTSSDVKFTFDRQKAIDDPNGPASLLVNLESVEAPDDLTVVFKLSDSNDQTFASVLSSPAAPIVDEEVFPADSVLDSQEIAESGAFAGPYVLETYRENEQVTYAKNPEYKGVLGQARNEGVDVKYYADASNLKLDIQQNNIDVAHRSLTATDIDDLRKDDNVTVVEGQGGEIRYLTFNLNTQPYGATTPEADEEKAKAVRQAVAASIDRDALAKDVYRDTYSPLYSHVADGLLGATEPLKELYLADDGKPDAGKARDILEAAGVTTPVELNVQYNPDHYGPSSGDEYAAIKAQLEGTGLFAVDLQSTEWVQYQKNRVADAYPVYQLGWFADFPDPDNYLTPLFAPGSNFLNNHFENTAITDELNKSSHEQDEAARVEELATVQRELAEELPTVPLLQGKQTVVTGTDIDGVVLDVSVGFRYALLSRR
ncbi:peptide ABC transporter substrate-binding protein [Corynebacterium sp. BCW_4722]|nr:peptide ABC transporter substrate-binding protein [Corynebacterium sp. BCW_4722]